MPYRLLITLTDAERAELQARAKAGHISKASVLRRVLSEPAPPPVRGAVSRDRALELLAENAEAGSWQAASALARELRLGKSDRAPVDEFSDLDELAQRRAG